MSGRLELKANGLVGNLVAEMADALEAMERGDYDAAFKILEARVRPADAMTRPPRAHSLPAARIGKMIFDSAPLGVLRTSHDFFVDSAAAVLATVLDKRTNEMDVDKLAVAAVHAADCGLVLEWHDTSEDEPG